MKEICSNNSSPEFKREAWFGLNFRWYGVDKNGYIAIFETGELPIPKKVFTSESEYLELSNFFKGLPQVTESKVVEEMARGKTIAGNSIDFSDWLFESNKGLFFIDEMDTAIGYDWYNGYYLITKPDKKLNILNLPERIRTLLTPFRIPISFLEVNKIYVSNYFDCE